MSSMPAIAPEIVAPLTRNRLLATLSSGELSKIAPWLEPVTLTLGQVLYHPDIRIEHVYFPTSGSISIVVLSADGAMEVASVGNEGFAGVAALLHAESMTTRTFVQAQGDAYRVEVDVIREVVSHSLPLQRILSRYALASINQLSQAVACNRLHSLEARCARWLLMAHDRADGDQILVTQDSLSYMLGVHRPAVTLVAGVLQKAGYIDYRRGKIVVTDRRGLESASCDCYQMLRDGFESLIGPRRFTL
jgi:CRP-like cAMP-binding protein